MGQDYKSEPCKRIRCTIKGNENWYIIVGHNFATAKFPFENRPEMEEIRSIVEEVCGAVTRGLRILNGLSDYEDDEDE